MEMEQIDLVIPLGKGSKWQNNELRYALRSIEKHLKNYRNIYLIGKCPEFISRIGYEEFELLSSDHIESHVIHIPYGDVSYRTDNIRLKILQACRTNNITEDFLFTNDDIFLLKDVDALDYPYYYEDDLLRTINRRRIIKGFDTYKQSLKNTFNVLRNYNCNIKYFDIHTPIIYNKEIFKKVVSKVDWNIQYGYTLKTLYCNFMGIEGTPIKDYKIKQKCNLQTLDTRLNKEDRYSFSIDDSGINDNLEVKLQELFPNKSKYEL